MAKKERVAKKEPVLEHHERTNQVWIKIKAHLEGRLALLRARNDNVKLGLQHTAYVRGRIEEVKQLMRLDEDAPVVADDNELFKD